MKKLLILVSVILMSACATQVLRLDKNVYPSVSAKDIQVYFKEKPECKGLKEIAIISTAYEWDINVAAARVKEKAAAIGADVVVINGYHKNGYNDVEIDASAYKCF